jgi:hypothetical protein
MGYALPAGTLAVRKAQRASTAVETVYEGQSTGTLAQLARSGTQFLEGVTDMSPRASPKLNPKTRRSGTEALQASMKKSPSKEKEGSTLGDWTDTPAPKRQLWTDTASSKPKLALSPNVGDDSVASPGKNHRASAAAASTLIRSETSGGFADMPRTSTNRNSTATGTESEYWNLFTDSVTMSPFHAQQNAVDTEQPLPPPEMAFKARKKASSKMMKTGFTSFDKEGRESTTRKSKIAWGQADQAPGDESRLKTASTNQFPGGEKSIMKSTTVSFQGDTATSLKSATTTGNGAGPKKKKTLAAAMQRAAAVSNKSMRTAEAEAKAKKGKKDTQPLVGQDKPPNPDDMDETGQAPKWQMYLCIFVFTIGPGIVLAVRGYLERSDCLDIATMCIDRCYYIFGVEDFEWQSKYLPRDDCIAKCTDASDDCTMKADAIFFGGLFLVSGFFFALLIFQLLSAISKRSDGVSIDEIKRPRPCYAEPVPTEEEKWKTKAQRRQSLGKRLRCYLCCCVPRRFSKEPRRLAEARCWNCDVKVMVEQRWLSCEDGCMDSSVCWKCRAPILGVM